MNTETLEQPAPDVPIDELPTLVLNSPDTTEVPEQEPPQDIPAIGESELDKQLGIQVLETSQAVTAPSKDSAQSYIAEQTSQHGVKGLLKKIWIGNIARDYIAQRREQKGREEITKSENFLILSGGSKAEQDKAMHAAVTRFTEGLLHSGERQEKLSDQNEGQRIENQLRVLVNYFAQGIIDSDELIEHKTRILDGLKEQLHKEDRDKGLMLADNVIEVAQAARAAFNHGIAMETIQAALTANFGDARMGQRTQASRELVDKVVDNLYKTPVGSMANETTISLAAAITISVAKLTTRRVISAAAAVLTMGAGAGIIAGAREYFHSGQERTQHIRERAVGGDVPSQGAKRREKMEETRYETVSATDLIDQLKIAQESISSANPSSVQNIFNTICDIEARISLSDAIDSDLIDYTSLSQLEIERLQLDRTLREVKDNTKQFIESLTDEQLGSIGLDRDFDQSLDDRVKSIEDLLNIEVEAKDDVFKRLRRNQALKMSAVGLVTGVTIGTVLQESRALFGDSLQGVFNESTNPSEHRTLLAGIFGHGSVTHLHDTLNGHGVQLGKFGTAELPAGYHIKEITPGHWELLNSDNKSIANNLTVDNHGALTSESQTALNNAGLHLQETTQSYTTELLEQTHISRSPEEFMHHHSADFTKVNRQLWYDNNTPNIFDQNELKLWWGGGGNNGLDEHGNYVFNVAQMNPDGSFNDGFSANAQQLIHDNKMAIALSMTEGTQSHVVMIPIDSHGNAVIKADSWMAHSLFEKQSGQAHFIGAYAEAVQLMGKHNGVESIRMLATVVGDNHVEHIADNVSHIAQQNHERIINHIILPESSTELIEIPPVLPIYARTGLEKLERYKRADRLQYGYGTNSPEDIRNWAEERSPRLTRNPDALLNPEEELSWYRQQLEDINGKAYLAEIDHAIEDSAILKEIDDKVKAIVCIPVGATSEADNIYSTLSLYAQQDPEAVSQTAVLLHVNWLEEAKSDPTKGAAIEKTITEIERAKNDFPELRIASFITVWTEEDVKQHDGVIGLVARRLWDTALMSIERANQESRHSGSEDVLLIRNDADARGVSRHYLRNMIRASAESPDTDAFVGSIRWDTAVFEDYPGYAAVSTFMNVMHSISGIAGTRVQTIGNNHAVRASTLAAIGGLGNEQRAGAGSDDILLGQRIYAARVSQPEVASYSSASSTYSSQVGYSTNTTTAPLQVVQSYPEANVSYSKLLHTRVEPHKTRAPVKMVGAALIDSAGERILNTYRSGEPITRTWDKFSEGGQRDRGAVDDDTSLIAPEDADKDLDSIVKRVQSNMEAMAEVWYRDPSFFRLGLSYVCPEFDTSGQRTYIFTWTNGKASFNFTTAGRQWFRDLIKNGENSLGRRSRRLNYQPFLSSQPALVSPI